MKKVYTIIIRGNLYNDEYPFYEPKDGNIEDEIKAILEAMKNGEIAKFTVNTI